MNPSLLSKISDKLKIALQGKFGNILSNNNITIFNFNPNTTHSLEIRGNNTLSIDISKCDDSEKRIIKTNVLDPLIQTEESPLLEDKSFQKTKQIRASLPEISDEELLKFYKDKISPEFYRALEASIIVKNIFNQGGDVSELKKDIAQKYPEFGNNICNLTTQGYFDNHFKELYNNMIEDEEFNIVNYQKKVEKIIKSLPYTVFITRHRSYDETSGEVKFKLERLKRYGTGRLLLHGIGKQNVETCVNILVEYQGDTGINIEKELNAQKTIITAQMVF